MAFDRIIFYRRGEKPTKEQIQLVLEDYVRGLAVSVEWSKDRFYVKLPGTKSHPARRLASPPPYEDESEERWFEVFVDDDATDVITRRADLVTSAIADGFAKICEQYWKGQED